MDVEGTDMADDTRAQPLPLANDTYAFLNHSATTLPNNLPPSIDDKPLARQKRKRTSPEDQALLETAYQRDPKPDKTARLELVKQVALGEKEVQIWFQNRRQSSRRKSRPLLPHEIAQYQASRAALEEGFVSSSPDPSGCQADESEDGPEQTASETSLASQPVLHPRETTLTSTSESTSGPPQAVQSLGYLANRRSAASLRPDGEERFETLKPTSTPQIKRTGSFIRLSLNAEGKAEVVTKDAASPSPPRPPQTQLIDVATPVLSTVPAIRQLQRSYSGRSRDSRSWEFWCDKESREDFGNTAEKDGSGSAAGAIGLLRTTSGRNILGNLSGKRNAPYSTHRPDKRSRLDQKRPPLRRSTTSMARLQGSAGHSMHAPNLKHSETALPRPKAGADSDKENKSPVSSVSDSSFRDRSASVHEGQHTSNSFLGGGSSKGSGNDADPENDEELAAFMRGGKGKPGSSAEEDLDCVQGLLSLSQGNWH